MFCWSKLASPTIARLTAGSRTASNTRARHFAKRMQSPVLLPEGTSDLLGCVSYLERTSRDAAQEPSVPPIASQPIDCRAAMDARPLFCDGMYQPQKTARGQAERLPPLASRTCLLY